MGCDSCLQTSFNSPCIIKINDSVGVIKTHNTYLNKNYYSKKQIMINPPENTPPVFTYTCPIILPLGEDVLKSSFVSVYMPWDKICSPGCCQVLPSERQSYNKYRDLSFPPHPSDLV